MLNIKRRKERINMKLPIDFAIHEKDLMELMKPSKRIRHRVFETDDINTIRKHMPKGKLTSVMLHIWVRDVEDAGRRDVLNVLDPDKAFFGSKTRLFWDVKHDENLEKRFRISLLMGLK
jgi:hypothetical protein